MISKGGCLFSCLSNSKYSKESSYIRHKLKEGVPEEESNGEALALLVGTGAGLHGEHTTKLACIYVRNVKTFSI